MSRRWQTIDARAYLAETDARLRKEGGVYLAALPEPLVVATPPLALAWTEGDGGCATLDLSAHPRLAAFFRAVEEAALEVATTRRADWLPGDDDPATKLRSFLGSDGGGSLRVRLAPEAMWFDAHGIEAQGVVPETPHRVLLRLAGITFGKYAFGARWDLVQARDATPPPPAPAPSPDCLLGADDEPEPEPEPEPEAPEPEPQAPEPEPVDPDFDA